MKSTTVAALTALLSAGALAVPMAGHHKAPAHGHFHMRNKRDIIWVTETEIETVVVMKTVYDDGTSPSEPTDAATTTIKATAPVTTSSSVVAAPSSPSENGGSAPPAYTPPTTTSSAAPAPTTSAYVPPPPPSSTTQAPAPTTYQEPAPAPTTYSPEPAPVPSYSAPAPAPSPSQPSGGSSGGGATFTGDATYWEPAMGACGWTNTASEDVVAISKTVFDEKTPGGNPNNNPLCGKMVAIKCSDGSTVQAKVVDRCVGCASGDLDMTKTLFDKVTGFGDGRVGGMQWSWA